VIIKAMKPMILATAAGMFLQIAHPADVPGTNWSAGPALSREAQLRKLTREVDAAENSYKTASGEASASAWKIYTTLNATNVPAVMGLVREDVQTVEAFNALVWVVTNRQVQGGSRLLQSCGLQAVELLQENHAATNPAIGPVCLAMASNWDWRHQPSLLFLAAIAANNPDRNARSQATFALASLQKRKAQALSLFENVPDLIAAEWRDFLIAEEKKGDSAKVRHEAERQFESVLQSYADCPTRLPGFTLGQRAAPALFELQHLWIGNIAPEIEGEDLDGEKMKLTDYRGKIVVLSFWGSWCGPCMGMIPHERTLAERMTGKPFALIGVDSDNDRLAGKRAVAAQKMTWPSFWCGTNGTDGAIPTAWNVKGWPTVYVLDPKGVIRLKLEGFGGTNTDNALNGTIDRLLAETADSGAKKK
jgi:thiol-disulfide isomerase/thioredoxin